MERRLDILIRNRLTGRGFRAAAPRYGVSPRRPLRVALGLLDVLLVVGSIVLAASRVGILFPAGDGGLAAPGTLAFYASRLNFNVGTKLDELITKQNALLQRGTDLLRSEYRGMTVNFEVDWKLLEPEVGQLTFRLFDRYVKFAQANDLTLNYAHLLWPTYPPSYPAWLFPDRLGSYCGTRTRHDLAQIVRTHVQDVIRHAASNPTMASWNVVNEAFDEQGAIRQDNCFYQILGEGYIDDLFRAAREATTTGTLILNEYFHSDTSPSGINLDKVDAVFAYVAAARARGVPIDVVGIQSHMISKTGNYFGPTYVIGLRHILDRARAIGVKVMITEMDVYQGDRTQDDVRRVYRDTLTTCLEYNNCVWFSTWGISDAFTWLHIFDTLSDAEPLLFDQNYERKPAYYGVLEALEDAPPR